MEMYFYICIFLVSSQVIFVTFPRRHQCRGREDAKRFLFENFILVVYLYCPHRNQREFSPSYRGESRDGRLKAPLVRWGGGSITKSVLTGGPGNPGGPIKPGGPISP